MLRAKAEGVPKASRKDQPDGPHLEPGLRGERVTGAVAEEAAAGKAMKRAEEMIKRIVEMARHPE